MNLPQELLDLPCPRCTAYRVHDRVGASQDGGHVVARCTTCGTEQVVTG